MKAKHRIDYKTLKKTGAIPWTCWRTVKRKIDADGFPAYCEDGRYFFVLEEVEMWFKKRKTSIAA